MKPFRLRALVFAVLLVLPGPLLTGCAAGSKAYHKEVVAEHDFKSTVQAFQDAEIAEFSGGNVPPSAHIRMQSTIVQLAQAGADLNTLLQQNAAATTVQAKLNAIYGLLDSLLNDGVLQVKNQKTVANLELALDAVKAIVTNIFTFLPTTATPQPTPAPVQ